MASWCLTALVTSALFGLAGCAGKPALPVLGEVPPFMLTDQTGVVFDSAVALNRKIWVADFFFTSCPGPCPRMSSQMHQAQTELASDDFRFVSFTVDPAHDTPPVLAEYSKHFAAIPGKWWFLTGPVPELQKLGKDAFKLNDVDGSLDHSTRFALVDRSAKIRGYYLTSEKDAIPNLIADARRLLLEKTPEK